MSLPLHFMKVAGLGSCWVYRKIMSGIGGQTGQAGDTFPDWEQNMLSRQEVQSIRDLPSVTYRPCPAAGVRRRQSTACGC